MRSATHAEALLTLDPAFEAAVRHWERRLGELNVMVEAVEPPPEVWDRIKTQLGPVERRLTNDSTLGPREERCFSQLPKKRLRIRCRRQPGSKRRRPVEVPVDAPAVLPPLAAGTGQY